MTATLLIARHGNTFLQGETPTRVGARTDLALVPSGEEQARRLGDYLSAQGLIPARVVTSQLRRTRQTAAIALEVMGLDVPVTPHPGFNEIDYGPDENLPEDRVRARLGEDALRDWDESGIMPDGWSPRPDAIRAMWRDFAASVEGTVLVVTSNGIARFALDLASSGAAEGLKLSTGALGVLKREDGEDWTLAGWNIRP